MSICCDVILRTGATPEQLNALGTALWRWGNGAAGDSGLYQRLDDQGLADLIAGRLPPLSIPPAGRSEHCGFHYVLCDGLSRDRETAIDRLRRQIPPQAVEDILVDGTSWEPDRASKKKK
jgi:hypothetical protein